MFFSDPVKAKAVKPGIFKLCTIGLFEKIYPIILITNKTKENYLKRISSFLINCSKSNKFETPKLEIPG
jgi:hypothetical protein